MNLNDAITLYYAEAEYQVWLKAFEMFAAEDNLMALGRS